MSFGCQSKTEISKLTDTDSTGLPGDNFNLKGALALFKTSKSPEAFENGLNAKDNDINNLDLNGDSVVDYINIFEKANGSAHVFVLQIHVNEKESQDVAVIELQKSEKEQAIVQIVGNQLLYGDSVIVEPIADKNGNNVTMASMFTGSVYEAGMLVEVNVMPWPVVQYV